MEPDPERPGAAAELADRQQRASSFGAAAAQYAQHRPGYAGPAIRWCLEPVPGGVFAGLWNTDDDRVSWVAGLNAISQSGPTWSNSHPAPEADAGQAPLLAGSTWFAPAESREFSHGQLRTAESLTATIATHSKLLVMEEPERAGVLAAVGDFLRHRPETSAGEFTLPLVTLALRAVRRP